MTYGSPHRVLNKAALYEFHILAAAFDLDTKAVFVVTLRHPGLEDRVPLKSTLYAQSMGTST